MTLSQNQIKKLHRDALTALETGRAREAHQLCMSILQEDRRHADAWFLCGVIAGQNGKYSKAIEILEADPYLIDPKNQIIYEILERTSGGKITWGRIS